MGRDYKKAFGKGKGILPNRESTQESGFSQWRESLILEALWNIKIKKVLESSSE